MASGNGASVKTVTVFGGGGFIGHHLIRRLGSAKAVVRVPSRHVTRLKDLRTNGVVGQIVPEMIDLFDDVELTAAIRGSDTVINLIGILAPSGSSTFMRIHCDVAARIARIAAQEGVARLVQVSALGASME